MEDLKKNQIHTCEIEAWSSDGAGVARIGGRAVFVPGTIPGETWDVRIVKVTASAVFGKGERCITPSEARIAPDCPVFPRCGGCTLRHMNYEKELEYKLRQVNDAYRHVGGLTLEAKEILGAPSPDGYRNKAIYSVTPDLRPGFFRPRSHDVMPVERCLLQSEASDRAAHAVCAFCRENGIPAYDEQTGKGVLRHIFTRTARSGELQITVVAARGFGTKTDALISALRSACPEAVSIILNVNKTRGNTVLAGDFYTLWGSDTLSDTLCGLKFELSPMSFYQVNPVQAERLYAKALEYAAPEGKGTVLDLYCGAGTISLCLARGAEKVIGAEIVPAAVENARQNAARNDLTNAEFLCADAGEAAAELARRGVKPDAVVVDPPRKGLSQEVIDAIAVMAPERVVYVSCSVATQARDLKLFAEKGYTVVDAVAVDQFSRTSHVETVVLLSKLKSTHHIEVEIKMDEMDLTKSESKATYDEIKQYVFDKYGIKVSQLYIAQVKRKHGLIERINYNKGEGKNRVPQVTPEKESAIEDALRHFQMIE